MKLFRTTLRGYFWKLYSNIQIYKYYLGVILTISIWYVQRNREVYFSDFAFSLADGYVISINRWMNILIIFPMTFFTTFKILESTYSIQQVLRVHRLKRIWLIQIIEYVINAIIMSIILTFVVCVANLDTMNTIINFSEPDSIFAFYNQGNTSDTIKIWHVVLGFTVCEIVLILSGSMLIAFLNIFFDIKSSMIISGILLVGETFLGWNILGISNINISYFRWYPDVSFQIQKAILVILIEVLIGFVFIRVKDILYGNAEVF